MTDRQPVLTHTRGRSALIVLGQASLIASALAGMLEVWRRDFHFPLDFSTEALFHLMQSRSTIDNGWWWFNPMLGAPTGLDELGFLSNSNVNQAIVWTMSRFVAHPFLAVNLTWGLMVVLSGLSATWCLRKLGVSTWTAVVAGTLFAVCPYAVYRNLGYFALVIYLVPFVSTAALLLASGEIPAQWHRKRFFWCLLIGCALLGFNDISYAIFGCFFLAVATLPGYLANRRVRILGFGAGIITLIAGCTLLNLAPSLSSWSNNLRGNAPADAEVYGLKIRQLVSPPLRHAFPPFRWWGEKELAADFPEENENATSRLGLIGTLGFLGLLGVLLVPSLVERLGSGRLLIGASRLTIAAVLLGTIGGLGSLFNLLVSPEIRIYSRITPFLSFFSLTAVAFAMEAMLKAQSRRNIAAAVILAVGLADQAMAAKELSRTYAAITEEIPGLEAFVGKLEAQLPERSMVLQLPFRTPLSDSGIARMQPYDHLKLYLISHSIRWSYPALSDAQARWQVAAGLNLRRLPLRLAAEGFAAIVIDRYGYRDNGNAVLVALSSLGLQKAAVLAETPRYVAVDIRALADGRATQPTLLSGACAGAPQGLPAVCDVWGDEGDVPAPGDYDGDSSTDVAVFRPANGTWYIRNSSTGSMSSLVWGEAGDVPVPGDYDGDGKTDVAVFRVLSRTWLIRHSSTGAAFSLVWGGVGDALVPGDYDKDGRTDIAVFSASTGIWEIRNSSSGARTTIPWVGGNVVAVPGDYDADGRTDVAAFDPSSGQWHIRNAYTGLDEGPILGVAGDTPVPGDYDGDGKTDVAVFRPSNKAWYLRSSSSGLMTTVVWDVASGMPIVRRP